MREAHIFPAGSECWTQSPPVLNSRLQVKLLATDSSLEIPRGSGGHWLENGMPGAQVESGSIL